MRLPTLLSAVVLVLPTAAPAQGAADLARWQRQAGDVTIIRDDWGIAHVYGKTDADAVFGMIYAQAEDDFNRVEANYLFALGREAEAEGESAIYRDLRMKLFIDPDTLRALYASSPPDLKALMDAWADGLNYFLQTHPTVTPRAITRFEPWMALSFTEGSIGGDIERVSIRALEAFYGGQGMGTLLRDETAPVFEEPRGSNGIAIAPKNTLNGRALLWINPHTSFYFRSELQMTSEEGLNAYGAVTWGQIFIYQGFNARAGWMHTSSGVDNIDEFLETIVQRNGRYSYRHGTRLRPVRVRTIDIPYRTAAGMATKTFTTYYTPHGPIVRAQGDQWVSVSLMQDPVNALTQSYERTKASGYDEYVKLMELHTNSSNNTLFADADGNIAYFHANYIPRRDTTFDWGEPVDGSDPATDYHGVLTFGETPNAVNPSVGWVYNVNNWPWSAAGPDSPRRPDYPVYVERGRHETARGQHALRILPDRSDWTMASLTAAAFDSYLPAFATMLPALVRAYDALPTTDTLRARLAGPMAVLRPWNYRWGANSVATSVAVYWGSEIQRRNFRDAGAADMGIEEFIGTRASAAELLGALTKAIDELTADFGTWQTPWGKINRFQRINDDIDPSFDDTKPSIPVPFTSARWGSLASFGARQYPNTKRWYGSSGNSFVAVVEFGDSVRARAVTAGGESGDPASPHFNDQAVHYAMGSLREVYYYRSQLAGHIEREYHPGE